MSGTTYRCKKVKVKVKENPSLDVGACIVYNINEWQEQTVKKGGVFITYELKKIKI